ncbi:MAG: hypothetical protein AAB628_02770 [Patescibacteria group bacterium]
MNDKSPEWIETYLEWTGLPPELPLLSQFLEDPVVQHTVRALLG